MSLGAENWCEDDIIVTGTKVKEKSNGSCFFLIMYTGSLVQGILIKNFKKMAF